MAGESNESDLLAAIIGELKTALSLPDARCYPVFAPNTQKPNFTGSGNYVLQVSLGDPQALQDEQGQEILLESVPIEVTIYTTIKLDKKDRDDKAIYEVNRGMLPLRRRVRRALTGLQVEGGASLVHWESASRPNYDAQEGVSWQTVYFSVDLDLDLISADDEEP